MASMESHSARGASAADDVLETDCGRGNFSADRRGGLCMLRVPFHAMDSLVALLRQNARTSVEDLAKELSLTPAVVTERLAQLEAEGIVLGYQAIVDQQKVQSGLVTAVVEVRITPERGGGFDRLAGRIANFAEVQSCYLISGGYDLLVVVEGNTLQDIAAFISEKLSTIKGVISTATRFRLKTYKENGVSLLRESKPERLAVTP